MNEKCNDRYTFQTNKIPTSIPDLIFKYQNTMNFTWSGSSSYVNNPVYYHACCNRKNCNLQLEFFLEKKGKKQEPIGKHSSKKYKHKFKKDNSG
jgi:hypothetical protein